MANFGPQIAADVLAACVAGAAEAAQALSRALDGTFSLTPGSPTTYDTATLAHDFAGPGLVLALEVGPSGALVILPDASGLLPEWYAHPDATGQSKLSTLAQELGMLLLPDAYLATDFKAHRVAHVAAALKRGGVANGAGVIPLTLTGASASGTLYVVWPASNWKQAFEEPAAPPSPPAAEKNHASESAGNAKFLPATKPRFKDFDEAIEALPPYGRSLLRIRVPVIVTLAATKQPVGRIVELGPGSIIQFDKPCTEPLELEVGQQTVASGEAVKVGEKFGLRITAIVLPEERFITIRGRKAS